MRLFRFAFDRAPADECADTQDQILWPCATSSMQACSAHCIISSVQLDVG